MALVVGQNSWVTVTEADEYLADRINATEWFGLNEVEEEGEVSKETLLITAFFWLSGSPQLSLLPTLTNDSVKRAQIEAAFFLMEHYSALNERRAAIFTGVEDFKLSNRREKLNIINLQVPDHILGMLDVYSVVNTTTTLKGEYDL